MGSQIYAGIRKIFKKPIVNHSLIGALIGYFFFHPVTMVIYHFTYYQSKTAGCDFLDAAVKHLVMAFRPAMLPMALLYTLVGAVIGLFYGYYAQIILRKNQLLRENEQQLREHLLLIEKQASLGIIASSIGHEINNILTAVMGYCQLLQFQDETPQKIRADLDKIFKTSNDLVKLSRALLDLGRPRDSKEEEIDVCEVLDSVTETLVLCGVLKRMTITRAYTDCPLVIRGDRFLLEQVVRNLEMNSAQAMDGQGELILEAGRQPGDGAVYFRIKDSGPGIPEENLPRIFTPFFTTKGEKKGNGLGLSIVKQIINQLGGKITARNREEGGAEFEVVLPVT
ncbi:MAG TPA: HAMP domain-containing histidine kinase [Desulfobacteraceae bacterium]|nr:HAMP domain-containing histidine kinase [Desulfobacteraceae bacterium]